jgi:hypothetical protein
MTWSTLLNYLQNAAENSREAAPLAAGRLIFIYVPYK